MFSTFIDSVAAFSSMRSQQQTYIRLKDSQLAALAQLNQIVYGLEAQFDRDGTIRHLTMTSSKRLVSKNDTCSLRKKNPIALANAFLSSSIIKSLLGVQSQSLSLACVGSFPFGHRIHFKQTARIIGTDQTLIVRGGALTIAIDKMGEIFNITSTIRPSFVTAPSSKVISQSQAINQAQISFAQPTKAVNCQLMLSVHNGKLNPIYEVTLFGQRYENSFIYLIEAKTGEVVHKEAVILRSGRSYLEQELLSRLPSAPETVSSKLLTTSNTQLRRDPDSAKMLWLKPASVLASALLQTPEVSRPIAAQLSDTIIKDLPDAKVLRNRYLIMLLGHRGVPVYAKPDGSFCYRPSDPEFAAVSTFISLNSQINLYLELGLKTPNKPLRVFVDDKKVIDNAYFDPYNYELHIGVGSGLKRNGLNKHMAFDLGISSHEFGHNVVYLQSPSGDLRGVEGSAIHEAIGDVLGTIVMHYLVKLWYAQQFGQNFSAADIKADERIIGSYAAPPLGIRCQKNKMSMPDDFIGEPHTDGLIVGGALADILVFMATKPNTNAEDQIRLFVKITLMSLALVPAHKVSFTDLLRALLTADQQMTRGAYRENILRCFGRHGIMLTRSYIGSSQMKALAA
jgi:hypothetical protein